MKSFKLILILLFLVVLGCSKNETKENISETKSLQEIYFSLNVGNNYINDSSLGNWIIVHDENGNILDYSKYKNGDKLSFEAPKDSVSDNLRITILNSFYHTSEGQKKFFLETFPNVPKKSIWNFNSSIPNTNALLQNPIVGKFNINVNNIPEVKNHTLTGDNIILTTNTTISDSNQLVINNVDLHERNTYFLSILDGNNDLKYTFIKNVKDGDTLNLDYENFQNFDSYLNVNLPPNKYLSTPLSVIAYEKDLNQNSGVYTLNHRYDSSYWNVGLNYIKIGYLDIFEKYKVDFQLALEGYVYKYRKEGSKTENLIVPEKPNFTYEDSSIYDFSFSIDEDYIRKVNTWKYDSESSTIVWQIFSDSKANLNFNKLPIEITEAYPEMNIDSMKYKSTSIYTKSKSQLDFIEDLFISNDKNDEYELESVVIKK